MKKWIVVGVAAMGLLAWWQLASPMGGMVTPQDPGLPATESLVAAISDEAPDVVPGTDKGVRGAKLQLQVVDESEDPAAALGMEIVRRLFDDSRTRKKRDCLASGSPA